MKRSVVVCCVFWLIASNHVAYADEASPPWKETFSGFRLAEAASGDKAVLIVGPAATDNVAAEVLRSTLRANGSYGIVMDAAPLGEVAKLSDGDIVAKAGSLPTAVVVVVRTFPNSSGVRDRVSVVIYNKTGTVRASFAGAAGKPLQRLGGSQPAATQTPPKQPPSPSVPRAATTSNVGHTAAVVHRPARQYRENIGFGARLGFARTSFGGDDVADSPTGTNFTIGALALFPSSENLHSQMEVSYARRGASESGESLELDYIDVAFMLKPIIRTGALVDLHLLGGVVGSANIGARFKTNGNSVDIGDDVQKFELSLTAGGGVTIPNGRTTYLFDVRYILGLNSIDDTRADDDIKNRSLTFNAGFAY